LADELGILGEALHQDLLGAIQSGLGIFDGRNIAFCWAQIVFRFAFRIKRWIGKQRIRQRLKPCFASDLRFGAAFFLKRQV